MSSIEVRLGDRASPALARSLFTVLAAISSDRSLDLPRSSNPSRMCSNWRSRFLPQDRGGICILLFSPYGWSLPRFSGQHTVPGGGNSAAGGSGLCRVTWPKVRGVLNRQGVGVGARSASHRPNQKSLVVPDTPTIEDFSLEPCRALREHGRSGHAGVPEATSELVRRVARLFGEESRQLGLVTTYEVEGNRIRLFDCEKCVIELRDAHEEPRWGDAALRHEADEATTWLSVLGGGRHDMEGVVRPSCVRLQPECQGLGISLLISAIRLPIVHRVSLLPSRGGRSWTSDRPGGPCPPPLRARSFGPSSCRSPSWATRFQTVVVHGHGSTT